MEPAVIEDLMRHVWLSSGMFIVQKPTTELVRRPHRNGEGRWVLFFLLKGENETEPLTGFSFFFHRHFVFSLIFFSREAARVGKGNMEGK
jgi:hypothetical protein